VCLLSTGKIIICLLVAAEHHLLEQPGVEQMLERAVYGGLGNPVIPFAQIQQQFLGLKRPAETLHGVENRQALGGVLELALPEKLAEYKNLEAGDIKPLMAEQPMINENIPMREWDLGKRGKSRSPKRRRSRSHSAGRDRDRKRPRGRSPSPRHRHSRSRSPRQDRRLRGDAKDEQPLGKALDELFRKTVATPSIYWLPLTPGQIAEKEETRRQRMLERERRLAEINKMRRN